LYEDPAPLSQTKSAVNKIPEQKGSTIDAWPMILAIGVIGGVGGRLLYELNPSLWENAAVRVEDDTPRDGAIDDYLE